MTPRPLSRWFGCMPVRSPQCWLGVSLTSTMPEGLCLSVTLFTWGVFLSCVWGEWENGPNAEPSIFGDYTLPESFTVRLVRALLYAVAFTGVVVAMVVLLFVWSQHP